MALVEFFMVTLKAEDGERGVRHRQVQVVAGEKWAAHLSSSYLLQGNAGMGLIHLHSELSPDALHLGGRKE